MKVERILKITNGLDFPQNEIELALFNEAHKDFKHELDGSEIDPDKILERMNNQLLHELRIGSIIYRHDLVSNELVVKKVLSIYKCSDTKEMKISTYFGASNDMIFNTTIDNIRPIELKVDHLEGSGFVLHPWGYVKGKFLMTKEFLFRVGNGFDKEIKYVHELQNLYQALTGENLILNFNLP